MSCFVVSAMVSSNHESNHMPCAIGLALNAVLAPASSSSCRLDIPLSWDTAFCLLSHNGVTSLDYAK
jgi:hypothetical protein